MRRKSQLGFRPFSPPSLLLRGLTSSPLQLPPRFSAFFNHGGKYIVPEEGRRWVLRTIGAAWRVHKCQFKKNHYYKYSRNKTRWQHRPKRIPDDDFLKLLEIWSKKEEKTCSSRNRDLRRSQKNMHTTGPKSFARIREEMRNKDPNKEPPSLAKMFERTRQRKEGNTYKDPYDDTAKLIDDMRNYEPPKDGSGPSDAFIGVMGKESKGRHRLYGKGVTNKILKKVNWTTTSFVLPMELMDSLHASFEGKKSQIIDLRNKLEADHERKKAELQVEHERNKAKLEKMREDIQAQRDQIVEEAVRKIASRLPSEVVREFLA